MLYNSFMKRLLIEKLNNAGISISDTEADRLVQFFNILTETNKHLNLTRILSPEDAVEKHFRDSLEGMKLLPQGANLLDVGSGGGFPAIPLSIARCDVSVTMLDSTGKKVDFLNTVCNQLSLNAKAIHARAEEFANTSSREYYDVVTARAVASLPTLLEYCLPFVKVGGIFIAYKTGEEELLTAQKALSTLGGKLHATIPYELAGGDKRTLFVFEKIAPTPPKYPRGQGKPRQKPIQ